MIEATLKIDGDEVRIANFVIKQCIYDDMSYSWDVISDIVGYSCFFGTLEQAIKYCLEN